MMLRVPSTVNVYPAGYGGGLGQDETIDTSIPPIDSVPFSPGEISTFDPSAVYLPGGGALPPSSVPTPAPGGGGLTSQQLAAIISGAGQTAIALIKASGTPGLVPGTNVVYNPATGQFLPASGAILPGGASLNIPGVSGAVSTPLVIGGLALGVVVLMMVMRH